VFGEFVGAGPPPPPPPKRAPPPPPLQLEQEMADIVAACPEAATSTATPGAAASAVASFSAAADKLRELLEREVGRLTDAWWCRVAGCSKGRLELAGGWDHLITCTFPGMSSLRITRPVSRPCHAPASSVRAPAATLRRRCASTPPPWSSAPAPPSSAWRGARRRRSPRQLPRRRRCWRRPGAWAPMRSASPGSGSTRSRTGG